MKYTLQTTDSKKDGIIFNETTETTVYAVTGCIPRDRSSRCGWPIHAFLLSGVVLRNLDRAPLSEAQRNAGHAHSHHQPQR